MLYQRLGYRIIRVEPHPRGPDWTAWLAKPLARPGGTSS